MLSQAERDFEDPRNLIQSSHQSSSPVSSGQESHDPSRFPSSRHFLGVGYLPTVGLPTRFIPAGHRERLALTHSSVGALFPSSCYYVLRLGRKGQGPIAPGPFLPRPVLPLPVSFPTPRSFPSSFITFLLCARLPPAKKFLVFPTAGTLRVATLPHPM